MDYLPFFRRTNRFIKQATSNRQVLIIGHDQLEIPLMFAVAYQIGQGKKLERILEEILGELSSIKMDYFAFSDYNLNQLVLYQETRDVYEKDKLKDEEEISSDGDSDES